MALRTGSRVRIVDGHLDRQITEECFIGRTAVIIKEFPDDHFYKWFVEFEDDREFATSFQTNELEEIK